VGVFVGPQSLIEFTVMYIGLIITYRHVVSKLTKVEIIAVANEKKVRRNALVVCALCRNFAERTNLIGSGWR